MIKILKIWFFLGWVSLSHESFAQAKFIIKKEGFKKEAGTLTELPILQFKNIDKVEYFHDEQQLKKINRANNTLDDVELMRLLENYISHFGTKNFSVNYDVLWMLAQLYEKQGYVENAKWLYRIALKHNDDVIELIAQYYDSLTRLEKSYYVPIKYYYELVEFRKQIDTLFPPQGILVNMGNEINSLFEDYGPALSIDNQTIIFASKRNRIQNGMYEHVNEDLYQSEKQGNAWSQAMPLSSINSIYNEGTPTLSKDGKHMYFIRCGSPEGLGNCDIFEALKNEDGEWGEVKNLGKNINSPFWESHPSLSISGDTLYFTSDRSGGFGGSDIYFSYKDKNKEWAPAKNMGPIINTKGDEMSPFHHPIYDVLYFSSNNQLLNFGNFDLYKVNKNEKQWMEPKNIGPLVNGKGDELFFTIDSESKNLYYARSEIDNVNDLNIYSFPLPMEAQPLATTVFKGVLKDSVTGEGFSGIVSVIDLDQGIEVAPKFLKADGSFEFDLIDNNKYLLVLQGEDFFRIEEIINLEGNTEVEIHTPSIKTFRIQFSSIEFESNSAEIKEYMFADLEKLVDFMVDNQSTYLKISGHTDSKGDAGKNLSLSQTRAESIKNYIVGRGEIESHRITAKGMGSTMPIIEVEITEEDRKINRRVEFEIIKTNEISTFSE